MQGSGRCLSHQLYDNATLPASHFRESPKEARMTNAATQTIRRWQGWPKKPVTVLSAAISCSSSDTFCVYFIKVILYPEDHPEAKSSSPLLVISLCRTFASKKHQCCITCVFILVPVPLAGYVTNTASRKSTALIFGSEITTETKKMAGRPLRLNMLHASVSFLTARWHKDGIV